MTKKFQKYEGPAVLRGDAVKGDSASYAVFTGQGSSATHLTAAKVLDVIWRLPRCTGEANDAVLANTQLEMEDAPEIIEMT